MNFKTSSLPVTIAKQRVRVVFSEWGNSACFPIVCLHGLTGNGHDFDFIAPHLVEEGYRVIAIDLPGRGRSDFLEDPQQYHYATYLQVIYAVLANLDIHEADWLGVSLGGLLGLRAIADKKLSIRRLILNDIGPEVPQAALDFIYQVIKKPYYFESRDALQLRMRETRGLTWGPVSDLQWAYMAEHNVRKLGNGVYSYAYDPEIAHVFQTEPIGNKDLWACWQAIHCPVLLLQGGKSVLLTQEIIEKMRASGPSFELAAFEDCGHVPSLMAPQQIHRVVDWLR